MNKYGQLLHDWCSYLVKQNIPDTGDEYYGGFRCEACGIVHGRADNAVFPLVYEYYVTGEREFLDCAERLPVFRKKLSHADGSVQNDFESGWTGITAFSAINLLRTLLNFGSVLPKEIKEEIEKCAEASAQWVNENICGDYGAYINYFAAAANVNALAWKYYGDSKYREKAVLLLEYCLGHFTENGLLSGEGKPHDFRTEKGCAPVDIGYYAEESLPCLVSAAAALNDANALDRLSRYSLKLLDFMLPDGAWDNSFGVRNNKWTYYGSRTTDGCLAAFAFLSRYNKVFAEAFERAFELLSDCTHGGALYGGMQYYENEQKPCVHHTFCHACDLAQTLIAGIPDVSDRINLPCESEDRYVKYYPELDTCKIKNGSFLATVTSFDYSNSNFLRGAAHSSGGSMSLLYKKGAGAVLAGSVFEYKRTEPNNMQQPTENILHEPLILRAEYERGGVVYSTCLDKKAVVKVDEKEDCTSVFVSARFCSVEGVCADELKAEISYVINPDSVEINAGQINGDVRFILPVIRNSVAVETNCEYEKEKIFFLTGGFAADKYVFTLEKKVSVKLI